MTLTGRLRLIVVCLALLGCAEWALRRHVSAVGGQCYPDLQLPLRDLPLELNGDPSPHGTAANWRGEEHPAYSELRKQLTFEVDEVFFRLYQERTSGSLVQLYMVYSKVGDDRKHHPEICIRDVSGAAEDLAGRKRIALDADGRRLAQRFRFRTSSSTMTTVYYWHYTFPPLPDERRDWLQTLHLLLSSPSPSLTVQITTTAPPAELEGIERSLVAQIDATMCARHLPSGALIGCDRLPIGLSRE
jgi:hypothetical protein